MNYVGFFPLPGSSNSVLVLAEFSYSITTVVFKFLRVFHILILFLEHTFPLKNILPPPKEVEVLRTKMTHFIF